MTITLDGTNGIDTPDIDIAGEPLSAVFTATVTGSSGSSDWSGSDPVTAAITVSGLLSTDTPVVDIDLTGVTFANVADVQADWALVYAVSATSDDELTLYATAEPASEFDIVIQVTR